MTDRGGVRSRSAARWVEPERVFEMLGADGPAAVWWDPSGVGDDAFIGWALRDEDVIVGDRTDDVAAVLRDRLAADAVDSALLGWWGCLAYELDSAEEGFAREGGPGAVLAFVDRGIVFDRVAHTMTLIVLTGAAEAEEWPEATEARLRDVAEMPEAARRTSTVTWRWRHDRAAYLDRIARCQEAIARGDAYQLCLTNTISVDAPVPVDPIATYRRLRALSPTAHSGVLRVGERWLLSASPERFLAVDREGLARTRPMKGTRPRSAHPAEDRRLAEELVASEKERAENLMIVDLMRNDLSSVAAVGSVTVPELFAVESYRFSHQLVSTVEAVLDTDPVTAVLALFPAGSMTGAPKGSAMRILRELEEGPRGLYSGVWGRHSLDGSVDLAVVIRSIAIGPDGVRIGSGGGITALSDPAEEWDEVVLKARPMLLALGADPDDPAGASPVPDAGTGVGTGTIGFPGS